MDPTPWWSEEASGMLEGWGGGGLVMRPGTWFRPQSRCCSYDDNFGRRFSMTRFLHSPLSSVGTVPPYHKNTNKCDDSDKCTSNSKNTTSCHCKRTSVTNDDIPKTASVTSDDVTIKINKGSDVSSSSASSNKKAGAGDQKTPWQFVVDARGYEEVRAVTNSGMLTVEAKTNQGHTRMMGRYSTTLPPHVDPDTLTATLRDGRLTVSQKPESLVNVEKVLPITPGEEAMTVGDTHHQDLPQHLDHDSQQDRESEQQHSQQEKQEQPSPQ
ncbi:hypothetical protein Hamer_G022093 [Homarus americanus]|uniref:SHSP domain-containing protein n=1 Tax=Homarus americanus TaxID=6706 RepID=A0A8J5JRZ3_HOMAM|nr:hypothetical protein Hamer_G022093 [Homarus americanus]